MSFANTPATKPIKERNGLFIAIASIWNAATAVVLGCVRTTRARSASRFFARLDACAGEQRSDGTALGATYTELSVS